MEIPVEFINNKPYIQIYLNGTYLLNPYAIERLNEQEFEELDKAVNCLLHLTKKGIYVNIATIDDMPEDFQKRCGFIEGGE